MEVQRALERADVLVGYSAYLALLPEFSGKERVETGMRAEKERCEAALRLSREGKRVVVCCSGDSQVYGLASLLMELRGEEDEICVLPGVTAALSCAARLGAPISGDFAAVSLSDLLTPWEVIERRLRGAALGDFVLALYNPGSHARRDHLSRACAILLESRDAATPCGLVRAAGREGESVRILPLAQLADAEADMLTTVIVGSSQTVLRLGKMVTPRGYRL